jgi:NAD(P)-dependent dehydrogenase (short-subunit alcohol dehydrogenase family)
MKVGAGKALDLDSVTAIVTGASSGIGLEIARALAAAGAWVGMAARTESRLAAAADDIGGHPLACDISTPDGVRSLAGRVREIRGADPDIVVSSAGAFGVADLALTDPADFQAQLAANLYGPFLLIREFLPGMLERGSGHLVSIGSVAGRTPLRGNGAYAASKYGLRGLHEVLSEEVRGTGVRATLIEPSATDTPLWDPLEPDNRADLPSRASMLRPHQVAAAVLFAATQPPGVEVSVLALRATRA